MRKIRKTSEIKSELESVKKETGAAKIAVRDMKKFGEIKWKKVEFKRLEGKCYVWKASKGHIQCRKPVFLEKRKDEMELKAYAKI